VLFRPIPEFPDYQINEAGDVINRHGKLLTRSYNQRGIPTVGMMCKGVQYRRSVPKLVAQQFLKPHRFEAFDTPVQIDGDRTNCHVTNLEWRPNWFAYKYHIERQRCAEGCRRPWSITSIETDETFSTYCELAILYVALEMHIVRCKNSIHYTLFPHDIHLRDR
jgi:hypothetical protein